MSLVYDRDLINELLKIAQVPAPATTPQANPDQTKGIATKFLQNLQQLSSGPQESFTAEKGNANLSTKHLVDLPSLLRFLQTSGIATGGLKLVMPHATQAFGSAVQGDAEFKLLKPEQQKAYAKYPDVDGDNFQYYVYKDGLVKYIQDLEEKANTNDPRGRMMRPYLPRLLKQVNEELELTVPAAGQAKALDPSSILDQLPGVLVYEAPYETGSHQLKPAMLATHGALFQALTSFGIALKHGGETKLVKDFDGKDLCTVVQILYVRAKKDSETKGDEVAQSYVQLVTTLASSMNCSLGGEQDQQGQGQSGIQNVGYVTSNGGLTPQGATTLGQLEMPLILDQIVFDRIERFANQLQTMAPQTTSARSVLGILSQIRSKFPSMEVQNLRVATYDEIADEITQANGRPAEYIGFLSNLLTSVMQMLGVVSEMCRRAPSPATNELAQAIQDQTQNVLRNNYYGVRTLQSKLNDKLKEVANQVKQQQGRR